MTLRSVAGCHQVRSEGSGFYRVEQQGGTWWFITPDGAGFYAVGTDHANYNGHYCEKLGYSPYHRNCVKIHGDESVWADSTASRLLAWGFNTLGWGHSESLRHRGLAHVQHFEMGARFAKLDDISPPLTWTGFPNVFSPDFPRHCEETAARLCPPLAKDPMLLGYFTDNELEWYGRRGRPGGLLLEALSKDPRHAARDSALRLLRDRHRTVKDLNSSWNTTFSSFDEVQVTEESPTITPGLAEDAGAFLAIVAKKYFEATCGAIRKYDQNHLILGCRFGSNAPDPVWREAGRNCAVLSVNCYRKIDLSEGVPVDGFEDDLLRWYSLGKKPLMITEWSFPALDAGLPCSHGAGQRVPTQKDRARAFKVFQTLLFSTPFIVGSDYFMWVDEPALGISSSFPEDSNYGLVNEKDFPYAELTQAAAELNPGVCGMHLRSRVSVGSRPP